MSIQDPIANLFSSINNAQARSKDFVKVPSSSKKLALLSMLKQEGYIHSFVASEGSKPEIEIKLKYFEGAPVIKQLKRISKPGLRQYSNYKDLPEVNATFFGGITQFGNVLDYAKYLADTTDDNENTFKMFAAQLYALGHINSYKNLHMRRAIIFFGVAILSELIIIMLMTWGLTWSALFR